MVGSHVSEPMVDQRRLSHPSPGNDCNDVDILVWPCTIQKSDILLPTKNITSRNGQSGYGNLLRRKSCWRLTSSNTRNGSSRLLQALTSDSTARLYSACYRGYRLQEFGRVLKASPGVFLKESLKQDNDRLWDMFELFDRQRCA